MTTFPKIWSDEPRRITGGLVALLLASTLAGCPDSAQDAYPDRHTGDDRPVIVPPDLPDEAVDISAGATHNCALDSEGRAHCWGSDIEGESRPPDTSFSMLSSDWGKTCGLDDEGAVSCWGNPVGSAGELSDGDSGPYVDVSATDRRICAVATDGAVDCRGLDFVGGGPPQQLVATAVAIGGSHGCALESDGKPICWGSDEDGRASPPEVQLQAISAGIRHTCGLTDDGDAVCWGADDEGQAASRQGPFSAIAAGLQHTCALNEGGRVVCWGTNYDGQLQAPGHAFRAISAGYYHTCGVLDDGGISCWGANSHAQSTP